MIRQMQWALAFMGPVPGGMRSEYEALVDTLLVMEQIKTHPRLVELPKLINNDVEAAKAMLEEVKTDSPQMWHAIANWEAEFATALFSKEALQQPGPYGHADWRNPYRARQSSEKGGGGLRGVLSGLRS